MKTIELTDEEAAWLKTDCECNIRLWERHINDNFTEREIRIAKSILEKL